MKSIIACALVVLAVVVLTSAGPIQPSPMCQRVCPSPLPDVEFLLPHPERCELFCKCNVRGAIQYECPLISVGGDRLYFNPEIEACDWPVNVDCTND